MFYSGSIANTCYLQQLHNEEQCLPSVYEHLYDDDELFYKNMVDELRNPQNMIFWTEMQLKVITLMF